jgi:galactoside O-acetyltransferase
LTQLYASGNGNEKIVIGNNVTLNYNVMVNADNGGTIRIGNNCIIGPNVVFRTSNHVYSSKLIPMREQGHRPGTIVLQDDVWIGSHVTIIGNVVIGHGAIVGAGAVVNKDVCDFSIVAGVPAVVVGNR